MIIPLRACRACRAEGPGGICDQHRTEAAGLSADDAATWATAFRLLRNHVRRHGRIRIDKLRTRLRCELARRAAAADPTRGRPKWGRTKTGRGRWWYPGKKGNPGGGRPSGLTPEREAAVRELHSKGHSLRAIAKQLGTSSSTVRRWLQKLELAIAPQGKRAQVEAPHVRAFGVPRPGPEEIAELEAFVELIIGFATVPKTL